MLTKMYVRVGERVPVKCPFSEVCMHMKVSGTQMLAEILPGGRMAQLYRPDGSPFSFPITTGEAGFYEDDEGHYYYPTV